MQTIMTPNNASFHDIIDVTVADDNIRFALKNRPDQARNILSFILAISIGVDDNIRAGLQASIQARVEDLG